MATISIFPSGSDALANTAAEMIADVIRQYPCCVLGLATGSTPESTYAALAKMIRGGLPFDGVTTFNLDEYVGLSHDHPQSYWFYMFDKFFGPAGLYRDFSDFESRVNRPHGRVFIPDGVAQDLGGHCAEYERWIREKGGIDHQILGIGEDGHIAFNEPGTDLTSRTHIATLHDSTRRANARFFKSESDVPRRALTMGVQTILEARHIVLMATGSKKAAPISWALEGPVTPEITASVLQTHSHVTVFLDPDAARALKGGRK